MNDIVIQEWIDKVEETFAPLPLPSVSAETSPPDPVQTCQADGQRKRQLDDGTDQNVNFGGADTRSKRPRHHYPTPEEHFEEEQQWPEIEGVIEAAIMDDYDNGDGPALDMDQTPRAHVSDRTMFGNTSTYSLSSSSASISTTSSGATKRSRKSDGASPSKRAVLGSLLQPIIFRVFDKDTVPSDACAGVGQLYARIRQFEQSQGVLPAAEKEKLEELGHADPILDLAHVYFSKDHYRASLGGTPSLQDIDKLVKRARKFRTLGESEAAWNGFIDTQLLLLAEDASAHHDRITATNITTARIGPASLIPNTRANGRIEGKMVDFALVLEQSDVTRTAASRLPPNARQGVFSFNHTLYLPLLSRPIAVSIETKRQGENFQDALAQLGIWASAHFTRLTELLRAAGRPEVHPPMLPLLVAQGSDWKFLLAEKTLAGDVTIWNKLDIGDIATHRGVYTTISVLLLLIDWAETRYRPWFEENICSAAG